MKRIVIGEGYLDKLSSYGGEYMGWDLFKHGNTHHVHADVTAKRNFRQFRGKKIRLIAEIIK